MAVMVPKKGIDKIQCPWLSPLFHMTPAEAKRWMKSNASYVSLDTGDMIWLPYGSVPWTISTSDASSFAVWLPVMSEALYLQTNEEVRKEIVKVTDEFLSQTGDVYPWSKTADSIKRWLGVGQ